MIRAAAGMSLLTDSKLAAAEALDQAVSTLPDQAASAVVLCATSHHAREFPDILQSIRTNTQSRAVVGATGAGIIGPGGEVEHSPALAVLVMASDRITAGAAILPPLEPADAVEYLRVELPSLYRERGLLMTFMDPQNVRPDFLHRLAQTFPETPVIGAAAGWCTGQEGVSLAADSDSSGRGCAALHLAGCIEPAIGVAQAVLPEGPPRPITRARGNVIHQINSEPAGDHLTAFVDAQRAANPGPRTIEVFCLLADSPVDFDAGRYIVRNILAIEPATKNLSVAENVRVGQYIAFGIRSPKSARRSYRQMLERVSAALTARVPRAAILFDCCARGKTLYGRPNVDFEAYREFFPDIPLIGLFGFAEIGPIFWEGRKVRSAILNHTAVLTILTEPMEALGTA